MSRMHSVQLSDDLSARLAALAQATKRTKSYFIREAIERTLEDLEDAYLAEKAYEEFVASGRKAVPLEEVMKRHGLSD